MKYKVGDHVSILKLKKHGVVTKVLNAQSVSVQLGAVAIRCKTNELSPHTPSKKKEAGIGKIGLVTDIKTSARSRHESATIDLHGKTVADSLHALEKALNNLILAGGSRLEIIHGHGSGKVMRAVHEYLAKARVVKEFKIDDVNAGMTVAFL